MRFFFSSRRRHTRSLRDWSSDVCSSDLANLRATMWPSNLVLTGSALLGTNRFDLNAEFARTSSLPQKASLTDRKSTRLNSSHVEISYAVFCLKKKKKEYARKNIETDLKC